MTITKFENIHQARKIWKKDQMDQSQFFSEEKKSSIPLSLSSLFLHKEWTRNEGEDSPINTSKQLFHKKWRESNKKLMQKRFKYQDLNIVLENRNYTNNTNKDKNKDLVHAIKTGLVDL